MAESTETGRSAVLSACFATLPRRLTVIGGFILLGWLGVALASASGASAAPGGTHASPQHRAAAPNAPAAQRVVGELTRLVGPAATADVTQVAIRPLAPSTSSVAETAAPLTRTATEVIGAPMPASEPDGPPTAPVHTGGTSADAQATVRAIAGTVLAPAADAKPGTDTVAADEMPATDTAARLVDQAATVTAPLAHALTPATRALSTPLRDPVGQLTQPATAADGLLPALARTAAELHSPGTGEATPQLLAPVLGDLLGGPSDQPGPPADIPPVAVPAPVHAIPAVPGSDRGMHLTGRSTPSPTVRPADESLAAAPGSASVSHGPLAGLGVPAPLPVLPPVGPDTVLATGSGSAATSSSGSGTNLAAGCDGATSYRHATPLLGTARSAGDRPVRHSADEPPVSPD